MEYLNPWNWLPWGTATDIALVEEKMREATTYKSWKMTAELLDHLKGNDEWKNDPESDLYDYRLIEERYSALRESLDKEDIPNLVRLLRSGLLRNLGGLGRPQLYNRVHVGTKKLIENYIEVVVEGLDKILASDKLTLQNKFDIFWETRQAFGRSSLLLSGGAGLGMFHIGVIKALFENDMLPRVISGSSVGSIIASIVAVRNDDELPGLFHFTDVNFDAFETSGSFQRKLLRLLTRGVIMDIEKLQMMIRDNIGDFTFKEAFLKTNRILNITVAASSGCERPRLLNYLTAPDVLIWSAASASCALTGLYEPVELMAKTQEGKIISYHPSPLKWSDGSVEIDLPMTRLGELFNVNHFIVSQVNPHVVPFVQSTRATTHSTSLYQKLQNITMLEVKHRLHQISEFGLLPSWLQFLNLLTTQKYLGDINIVPQLSFDDYLHLLSNPTFEYAQECGRKTERNTWECIRFSFPP
eukprot:TRINITY_DN5935_c0_g1_i5.p1 TRINITY_DN5935_c0_g1~~TRINITY_DN5935_c0_g1_i5.p1  ORF type:complete len:470 (+),score=65.14 TRINITY_DN5935_c0_g1_i5:729-2138(+)